MTESVAGHDDGLGDGRVRVAEPGCWPWPHRGCGRRADHVHRPVEQRQRAGMVVPSIEDLGGAERRERHGVRPWRTDIRAALESGEGVFADPRGGTPGGSGAEGPDRQAPAVLRSWLVTPAAIVAKAITEPSVWRLCLGEEVKVAARQRNEFLGRRRLSAHHHHAAGHVVDAVAVLVPGHDSLGVLEQADVIGHPLQVPEGRIRVFHAAVPAGVPVSPAARRSGPEWPDEMVMAHRRQFRMAWRARRRPEQWLSVLRGLA